MRSIKTILTTLSIGLVASAGGCDPSEDPSSADPARDRMDAIELDSDDATSEEYFELMDEAIEADALPNVDSSLAIEDVDDAQRAWWCTDYCLTQWENCISAGRSEYLCADRLDVCLQICVF